MRPYLYGSLGIKSYFHESLGMRPSKLHSLWIFPLLFQTKLDFPAAGGELTGDIAHALGSYLHGKIPGEGDGSQSYPEVVASILYWPGMVIRSAPRHTAFHLLHCCFFLFFFACFTVYFAVRFIAVNASSLTCKYICAIPV